MHTLNQRQQWSCSQVFFIEQVYDQRLLPYLWLGPVWWITMVRKIAVFLSLLLTNSKNLKAWKPIGVIKLASSGPRMTAFGTWQNNYPIHYSPPAHEGWSIRPDLPPWSILGVKSPAWAPGLFASTHVVCWGARLRLKQLFSQSLHWSSQGKNGSPDKYQALPETAAPSDFGSKRRRAGKECTILMTHTRWLRV